MLFVPDEDYVRLPDHTTINTTTQTCTTTARDAADVADDVANDDKEKDEDKEEEVVDESVVVMSPSILFASQAQYLGHSNQVRQTLSQMILRE